MKSNTPVETFKASLDFVKSGAMKNPEGWQAFASRLQELALSPNRVQSVIAYLAESIADLSKTTRIRHLHMAEKEVVDTEAFGLLLDATRFGFIPPEEIEPVLEQVASYASLPINIDSMTSALAARWGQNLKSYKVH